MSPLDNLSGSTLSKEMPFFVLYKRNISTKTNIETINNNTLETSKKIGTKKPTTNNTATVAIK